MIDDKIALEAHKNALRVAKDTIKRLEAKEAETIKALKKQVELHENEIKALEAGQHS